MEYPAREFDAYLFEKIEKYHQTARSLFKSGAVESAMFTHQRASELEEVRDKFFRLFKSQLI